MKVLLILALFCVQSQVKDGDKIEKWTFVASGRDEVVRSYIAPETIKRGEDRIRLWFRADMPQGSAVLLAGTNFYSIRTDMELDCAGERTRSFKTLLYDFNGRKVGSEKGEDWIKETPNSIGWAVFQYFCEYKENPPTKPPTLKPNP